VIEFLKNSTSFQSLRTVTLTSSQDAKDRDRAHALGVFRFLNKPLHLDEFIRLGEIFKEIMVSRGT
jgi:CheY-like chemotaxis protein